MFRSFLFRLRFLIPVVLVVFLRGGEGGDSLWRIVFLSFFFLSSVIPLMYGDDSFDVW